MTLHSSNRGHTTMQLQVLMSLCVYSFKFDLISVHTCEYMLTPVFSVCHTVLYYRCPGIVLEFFSCISKHSMLGNIPRNCKRNHMLAAGDSRTCQPRFADRQWFGTNTWHATACMRLGVISHGPTYATTFGRLGLCSRGLTYATTCRRLGLGSGGRIVVFKRSH
jgi:hypothetical protein